MPSKTSKQRKTMRAAAHNPKFAKKVGIPTKVAKEFTAADRKKRSQKRLLGIPKGKNETARVTAHRRVANVQINYPGIKGTTGAVGGTRAQRQRRRQKKG